MTIDLPGGRRLVLAGGAWACFGSRAAHAEWGTPESRAEEDAIRQMVREEVPPASPDDDLRVAIVAMKGQRNRLGLSLQDVEDRIGIDRSTISRLETGKLANPTWATLKAYARGLGVSLRLLVGPTTATPFAVSASGSGRPREPDGTHADERHQDVAG